MRRLGLLLAVVVCGAFAVVVGAVPAYACSCRPSSVDEQLQRSDVIFRGKLTSSTPVRHRSDERVELRFDVDAVYKGQAFSDQVVASSDNSASCGFTPEVGTTWIVFALEGLEGSGDRTVTRLSSSSCSGNLATSTPPRLLGPPRSPIDGPSDAQEKTVIADQRVSRGFAYAGIGLLVVGAVSAIGLVWLWRPGRRR